MLKQREAVAEANYKKTPLWNEALSMEERLNYLLRELTLEEKLQCLTIRAPEVERLGLKDFSIGGEAAHGIEARRDQVFNKGMPVETTVFTQPIGLSSTWDTALMKKIGVVTGTQARAVYRMDESIGLSRWGPTVDMERDPRWGRNEEGYGEDPYLTGKMTSAYIRGLQGEDDFYLRCGATLKHFYANNEEEDREKSSSSLDVRNKMEYYLEPFRRAITEGRAEAVMTSYNEINGIPAILNPELKELVKEKWGLKGHVVCDMADLGQTVTAHRFCKTVAEALALGLKAGMDAFNDPEEEVIAAAREALEQGLITEGDIDSAIRNTFATKLRLGIYDAKGTCPYSQIDTKVLNCGEHQEVCLKAAEKAVVLLKNESHLLPVGQDTRDVIMVAGPLADVWNKDWYSGIPAERVTPWEGIKQELPKAELDYEDGIDRIKIKLGEQYIAVRQDGTCYLTDENAAEIFEHADWGDNKHTLRACGIKKYLSADTDTGAVLANKEEVFSWFVQEVFSLHEAEAKEQARDKAYRIESWKHTLLYTDQEGRLLCGKWDENRDAGADGAVARNITGSEETVFCFELVIDGIRKAAEAAKRADTVIAVMGCHPIISCKEGNDRRDCSFPPKQRELLQEIYQVNPNVILVLITNYPYAIDWEKENLPAILMTASGSQALGTAIAKAISGAYPPAGRLNMTWYPGDEQLPSKREYDIIHSKRTYQYYNGRVLYPFGYGLTYTEFYYHDLTVEAELEQLKVKLYVKNIGSFGSDEVVQLYISQQSSRTIRPIRQLKGFQRVYILQGEDKLVEFELPYHEFKYYDVVTCKMLLEDSNYELQLGPGSQDIRLTAILPVRGTVIPARDMSQPIRCDHYDSYDNLYLHRGYKGKPCILPGPDKVTPAFGRAVYEDAVFYHQPELMVIGMKAEEAGSITVWFGNEILAGMECRTMEDYEEVELALRSLEFEPGVRKPLKIEITGKIRLVEFYFR
jgi:beta-glucosidase